MITLDGLKALGADTDSGVARCVNDEQFYLRMVGMALQDANFEQLKESIEGGDLAKAFEQAHALKGVMGNVALTSLYEPIAAMTEELRAGNEIDYTDYLNQIFTELEKYRALL